MAIVKPQEMEQELLQAKRIIREKQERINYLEGLLEKRRLII